MPRTCPCPLHDPKRWRRASRCSRHASSPAKLVSVDGASRSLTMVGASAPPSMTEPCSPRATGPTGGPVPPGHRHDTPSGPEVRVRSVASSGSVHCLPLALAFGKAGLRSVGFDIDAAKVSSLREGISYPRLLRWGVGGGGGTAHADRRPGAAPCCDAIVICVPTRCQRHRHDDLRSSTPPSSSPRKRAAGVASSSSSPP